MRPIREILRTCSHKMYPSLLCMALFFCRSSANSFLQDNSIFLFTYFPELIWFFFRSASLRTQSHLLMLLILNIYIFMYYIYMQKWQKNDPFLLLWCQYQNLFFISMNFHSCHWRGASYAYANRNRFLRLFLPIFFSSYFCQHSHKISKKFGIKYYSFLPV